MSGADGLETAVEDGCAIGLVDAARDARGLEQVRGLLKASGLGLDADVELFATARDASGRLLACLGLAGDVVKCAASAPEVRGEGVTARLMQRILDEASDRGRTHLFAFTRPGNRAIL